MSKNGHRSDAILNRPLDAYLLISLLAIIGFATPARAEVFPQTCYKKVTTFLATPNRATLAAISGAKESDCWGMFTLPRGEYLRRLQKAVAGGNIWAAQYLAPHVDELGGGDLGDSLRAFGRFSDRHHNTKRLFLFVRDGQLSHWDLRQAMIMLPLSLVDHFHAQQALLKARKKRVMQIHEGGLMREKAEALKAISEFQTEIKSDTGIS